MLHVVLIILKIIGIVLGVILGILLALLLVALFVPVRYKAIGQKYEKINGILRISWLLHIVSAYVSYDNDKVIYKVRIFGFPIVNSLKDDLESEDNFEKTKKSGKTKKDKKPKQHKDKKVKHQKSKNQKSKGKTDTYKGDSYQKESDYEKLDTEFDVDDVIEVTEIPKSEIPELEIPKSEIPKSESSAAKIQTSTISISENDDTINHDTINDDTICDDTKDNGVFAKIRALCSRFQSIFGSLKSIAFKIIETIKGIFNKTINFKDAVVEKIDFFNQEINTEENRQLLKFMVGQIKLVCKHIAPRRYKIYVRFGSSEPDVTGKIIGYIAMINAFFNLRINLVPVFDEAVFEGKVSIRGHIRLFPMLLIALRVYRNKQFKKMIKKFK